MHNPEYTKEYIENLKLDLTNKDEISHTKSCAYCGKDFPKSNISIFCSEECKNKAKLQKFSTYPTIEEVELKYKELHS